MIARALHEAWGLDADAVEYAPVGFGSYHWHVVAGGERWFVTVDDLTKRAAPLADDSLRRLSAALSTARTLRDAGLEFVIAPVRTRGGSIVQPLDSRYATAVYPHVDGERHEWSPFPSRRDRLAVLDRIAALHTAPASARRHALVDDLSIPRRDELAAALDGTIRRPWPGPFGEQARSLVDRHTGDLMRAFERYDRLAARVARTAERRDRLVLTHGEPHRGNTITTRSGLVLIDWDTTLVAPPERDLWALAAEDAQIPADYADRTGTTPEPDVLALYSLRWTLTDVAIFVHQFRRPHDADEDTLVAWQGLNRYLQELAA